MVQQVFHQFLRWPLLVRIFLIAISLMTVFGILIHFVEPDTFPSYFDGIWWAVITMSTVGYGDFVPATTEGRLFGVLLILVGAGFLSTYFITLATNTVMSQNAYIEGKATFKGKDHVVIIGWNERAREIINQLSSLHFNGEIILIDETLQQNPYRNHHIHFIKGEPFKDKVLEKASMHEASIALITADQNRNEIEADMHSILTLLAVKGNHPNVYTVVEILQKDQVLNAERAGADEVIQTNLQSGYVMINSIISKGMSKAILKLLNHLKGNHLQLVPVTEDCLNQTFQSLSESLLEHNIILLGIKKGEETLVNPPLTTMAEASDELLVITN
ncbi:potassium channel family protein [Rossellomorea aquimaris]|jgi:voltage-gated potassium channel|uniref:Ion transporter n=1 Tax=Rossellomorea aquimaris TaxID=189382 RepID=A0A1J6W3M7_9BACI|nr:potassium channel family protein [Rossellomorea aquimaris]OIU72774.1 ion transporter [Rossellomorea aquimaris]